MNGFFLSVIRGRVITTAMGAAEHADAKPPLSWTSRAGSSQRGRVVPATARTACLSINRRAWPPRVMLFTVGTSFRAASWAHSLDMGAAYGAPQRLGNWFSRHFFVAPRLPRFAQLALLARANQALLDHRYHQAALLGEYFPPRQAPGAAQRRRLLGVEQPPVGAERAVEPHRVVEAGPFGVAVRPRQALPEQHSVEHRHV